jgi:hypothetical protein
MKNIGYKISKKIASSMLTMYRNQIVMLKYQAASVISLAMLSNQPI